MPKEKTAQPQRKSKLRKRGSQTAQQTIPYREMHRDGICRISEDYYTKTIEYEDINYAVASTEDQGIIFDGYCGFLNYFDATLPYQPARRAGTASISRPRTTSTTASGTSTPGC